MLLLAALFAAVAASEIEVIAEGFNDPRFITEHEGRLYVTAAGIDSETGVVPNGAVYELRRDDEDHHDDHDHDDDDDDHHHRRHYHVRRLATFDSIDDEGGSGPAGIAVHDGRIYVVNQISSDAIVALPTDPETVAQVARELDFGKLVAFDVDNDDDDDADHRRKYYIGDPGHAGFIYQQNGIALNVPGAVFQPEAPDSDPYGIYYDERDDTIYVANAGSNTLQAVKDGRVRTVAFFPATSNIVNTSTPAFNFTTGLYNTFEGAPLVAGGNYVGDATPTAVTKGPDGHLYVTTLEFVQSATSTSGGASHLYRVDPHADNYLVTPQDIVASGFGFATDVKYSHHHHAFFIVQQNTPGQGFGPSAAPGVLLRFDVEREHHDHDDDDDDSHWHGRHLTVRSTPRVIGAGVFTNPNGVAVTDDGEIYVTDFTVGAAGAGRVLRVRHED